MREKTRSSSSGVFVPHRGSLCRFEDEHGVVFYAIEIRVVDEASAAAAAAAQGNDDNINGENNKLLFDNHELVFTRHDFEFASNLFAIVDTENRGLVDQTAVQEFATLRCPVFWRRDEDYNGHNQASNSSHSSSSNSASCSPTFDEIWKSVVSCSQTTPNEWSQNDERLHQCELSVEGWLVFCRFICLAQYLEAKRRFSARHLQQTMRHRNAPRGSEVVVVDVPPPTPPAHISPERLAQTELVYNKAPLPLPELDLDHSLLAAHESSYSSPHPSSQRQYLRNQNQNGTVRIELFGSTSPSSTGTTSTNQAASSFSAGGLLPSSSSSQKSSVKDSNNLEFALTFTRGGRPATTTHPNSGSLTPHKAATSSEHVVVVRRSMADMKWLDDTFSSHRVLGGTLCGRILPPFPGSYSPHKKFKSSWRRYPYTTGSRSSSALDDSSNLLKSSTNGAMAVAAAGVGKIRKVAKSWLLGMSSSSSSSNSEEHASSSLNTLTRDETTTSTSGSSTVAASATSSSSNLTSTQHHHGGGMKQASSTMKMLSVPKTSLPGVNGYYPYNPNSPMGKARQLERYLNYLLEHPALSTSFPLNTILTASQSGLDAARKALEECTRESNQLRDQTPQLDSYWSNSTSTGAGHTGTSSNGTSSGGTSGGGGVGDLASPNFAWVRTAAQAAMALRVHGMLETTGMPSASARLQHASLPAFAGGNHRRVGHGWEDDHAPMATAPPHGQAYTVTATIDATFDNEATAQAGFEEGVIQVESELLTDAPEAVVHYDDDYDLLPLPVPAPERRILNAGSCVQASGDSSERQARFHYGTSDHTSAMQNAYLCDDEGARSAVLLGSISVDENIDKLREVIGSADNILSRCLMASGGIGAARCERQAVQLDVVRGLDAWHGMRGKFVSQRSLMKGVAGIEQSKEIYEESDCILVDDISWQTSLASAAVGAAEDVRSAVRAARTAANAKAAASQAAMSAQAACDAASFATLDEARAAQTRTAIAQSHAIHAAVVEHEAKAVKRRATLALAHDVKCWNVHRKREMLQSCMAYAKSQHEATRRAVDAWSSLSDGFIRSTVIPSAPDRRFSAPTPRPTQNKPDRGLADSAEEVTAKIYGNAISESCESQPTIVAVDHELFAPSSPSEEVPPPLPPAPPALPAKAEILPSSADDEGLAKAPTGLFQADLILPFATASPILEEEEADVDEEGGGCNDDDGNDFSDSQSHQRQPETQRDERSSSASFLEQQQRLLQQEDTSSHFEASTFLEQQQQASQQQGKESSHFGSSFMEQQDPTATDDENPILSESMQSLVNGLMTWGGGGDPDEDHFALPAGLAASIVMEDALGQS